MHFLERFYPELEESLTDVHGCSLHMLGALSPSSEGGQRCTCNRVLRLQKHRASKSLAQHSQPFPILSQTCLKEKIYYPDFFIMPVKPTWKDASLKLDAEENCTWPCILHFWILDKFILILWTYFWNGILILGQFNLSSKKGTVFRFTTAFSTVSLSYSCTGCGKKKKKSKMIPTAHYNK